MQHVRADSHEFLNIVKYVEPKLVECDQCYQRRQMMQKYFGHYCCGPHTGFLQQIAVHIRIRNLRQQLV